MTGNTMETNDLLQELQREQESSVWAVARKVADICDIGGIHWTAKQNSKEFSDLYGFAIGDNTIHWPQGFTSFRLSELPLSDERINALAADVLGFPVNSLDHLMLKHARAMKALEDVERTIESAKQQRSFYQRKLDVIDQMLKALGK